MPLSWFYLTFRGQKQRNWDTGKENLTQWTPTIKALYVFNRSIHGLLTYQRIIASFLKRLNTKSWRNFKTCTGLLMNWNWIFIRYQSTVYTYAYNQWISILNQTTAFIYFNSIDSFRWRNKLLLMAYTKDSNLKQIQCFNTCIIIYQFRKFIVFNVGNWL